jgi:GTP-binding protein Era
MNHKAGFVNIIGMPNVGKSTLINSLINDSLSIVNSKAQTTRQNIKGFINGADYQIILVDTPGWIEKPAYELQKAMNQHVDLAFEEGDIFLFVVDKYTEFESTHPLIQKFNSMSSHIIVIINKIDLYKQEEVEQLILQYQSLIPSGEIIPVSAMERVGVDYLLHQIVAKLPESPPYYDKEEWTDKNTRFFCSEIIRERIFTHYQKEVPYSCEVVIDQFEEREHSVKIDAIIYVERETQKNIIIGHQGEKIKQVSMEARKEIESLLDTKVHLFLFVKVLENWRSKENILKQMGYTIKK